MTPVGTAPKRSLLPRLVLLTAFGVGFGHIEAVVLVYIRRIMDWVPPSPAISAQDVAELPNWLIHTEQTREAATIIVLLALATLVGRSFLEKLATFLFAFGVWDLTYYAALKAMIRWPESFTTQDCLFLIPHPWLAPVWIPMVCSLGMIAVAVGIMAAIEGRSGSRSPS